MCFSERVSWLTLAASWTGSAALAASAAPAADWRVPLAGFLAVVGAMQLWEALLWRERGCTPRNGTLSGLGAVNNHVEPLVLYALCAALVRPRSAARASLAGGVVAAYAAVAAVLTVAFLRRPLERRCTTTAAAAHVGGGSLVWQWNQHGADASRLLYGLFALALLATVYAYFPEGVDHAAAAAVCGSLALSWALYRDAGMVGSMWCYFAALLPWAALVLAP